MEFSSYIKEDKLVITPLEENLDAKNSPAFKEEIFLLLESTDIIKVIIDLTNLQFIDSSGLGVLLSLQRNLRSQKGTLKLVHLNKPVRTMFEIVSMHKVLEIFPTLDEALESMS
ncbi:MAG: STAS domain-containing protein [Candidatus Protochlamydia sp.]|nr:STAS domain-containing protein [Candidatus Protochlamydia sp.]